MHIATTLPEKSWQFVPRFRHVLLFAGAYILAAALGQWLVLVPGHSATLWPPSGLYLAVLLKCDRRTWWRLILVGWLADIFAGVSIFDFSVQVGACGDRKQSRGSLRRLLVQRYCGTPFRFSGVRDVSGLALLGSGLSPIISAVMGATTMAWSGRQAFTEVAPLWWTGDAIGVLIVAPLILVILTRTNWQRLISVRRVEFTAFAISLVSVTLLILSGRFPFVVIALPLLIWGPMRFGLPGAALVLSSLTVSVVRNTVMGHGIFANPTFTPEKAALMLQLFLGIISVSFLMLAALVEQDQLHLQELKRAFEELELRVEERTTAEQRLRLAQQVAHIGTFDWDITSGVNVWTPELEVMYGLEAGTFGRTQTAWEQFVHPHDREMAQNRIREASESGLPIEGEWRIIRPDGNVRWIAARFQFFRDSAGKLARLMGVNIDITQRKQLEREVVEVAADEQRRLGQELHDGLGQELTALSLMASYVQEFLRQWEFRPADNEAASDRHAQFEKLRQAVENLCRNLHVTQCHLRDLSRGIMPVQIDAEGLRSALDELAASVSDPQRLVCRLDYPVAVTLANNSEATHLYRIAQEAVNNAVKHSQASHIQIAIRQNGNTTLEVTDNGIGINSIATRSGPQKGMGLRTMQYRASILGAKLDIQGAQGAGTSVRCTLAGDGR